MDGYGKRVLIAEDDAALRTVVCVILSEAGYNVYEACDGLEALDALKKRRYDAVLTDYHMPKLDGLELLDVAQAMWPHTPIILASSNALLTEQAGHNLLAPAYAVLPKPFDPSDLLHTVRCATRGVPKELRSPIQTGSVRTYPAAA
ncbi:MAG: response regulator [Nitrospirae bacterium]|nr:response regulator [Nitrospirota bacterium]